MHEDNRKGWNEGAEVYEGELQERIEFLRKGGANFEPPELPYLANLSDWCQRAIHLQCAGGTDTLSLWNLGAHEVVGVDISDRMIGVAERKSAALGASAQWFRCDLLDTPSELDGTADLVYTGRGAICWIHDIPAWAAVVHRILRPGGKLYVFDTHPLSYVWDIKADDFRLDPVYGDYFSTKVYSEGGWPETYIGDLGKPEEEHAIKHERCWRLGEIMNPLVEAGMRLVKLEEHPDLFWDCYPNMPPERVRLLPQTFSLMMEKPL